MMGWIPWSLALVAALVGAFILLDPQAIDISNRLPADANEQTEDQQADREAANTYALVIGNERYDHFPDSVGAQASAELMAHHLRQGGFTLVGGQALINADWEDIARSFERMRAEVGDGGVGVVYYAGHVTTTAGENFLVPVNADTWTEETAAETLFRIENLWAFPSGRDPDALIVALETRGMLGMLGGGLIGTGTGLEDFSTPSNVILAVSDAPGQIILRAHASLDVVEERPWWRRWTRGARGDANLFTRTLVETSAFIEGDPVERLREVALVVREASQSEQTPALIASGTGATSYVLFRSEFAAMASSQATSPLAIVANLASAGLGGDILIKMMEGLRLTTYLDSAGIGTTGYGHTGPDVLPGASITQQQADEHLLQDMQTATDALDRAVEVEISINQRRALISFIYNVGTDAFARSSVLRRINEGDFERAAAEMLRWVHVHRGGQVFAVPGLVQRRELEAYLLLTPIQPTPPAVLIRMFEPFSPQITTIDGSRLQGFGSQVDSSEPAQMETVTETIALDWLDADVQDIQQQLATAIEVPLSHGQLAALTSYIHDVGFETFFRSPIRTRLNTGDYAGAANALRFAEHILDDGVLQFETAMIHRRAAEAALFFADGAFVATETSEYGIRPTN